MLINTAMLMSDGVRDGFAVAAFWTCFVSTAGILGVGGAEVLNRLDAAIYKAAEERFRHQNNRHQNKRTLGSPRS